MKKQFKKILFIILMLPIFINARINYEDAVQYANNYIFSFEDYRDYIYLNDRIPYSFEETGNQVNPNFQSGGFLSRHEYDLSNAKGNSYLSNGLQYWTLTQSSHLKHYIVDYKLTEQLDTNLSGVKITEFTKPDVMVSGKGTFGDPWTFEEVLTININSDNTIRGKVSTEECSNEEMRKESIYLNVVGNRSRMFYVCPEEGYKFLKSTCGKYITYHNGNMYTVDNLDRDNVICKVSYSYITKEITVKGCPSCQSATTDRKIYVNNNHKVWLQESDGITKIESISNMPTKTGYTFKGYYSEETYQNKIIDTNGKLIYNEVLNNKNKLFPYMKPNEYTIKYNCNGGTESTTDSKHTYDESKALTANGCKRTGYKFEGWSNTSTGVKIYSNGESVTNLTTENNDTVTLYAVWTKCPAGTYGSNGVSCTNCPAGTYNANTGSTSSTACTKCPAGTYNANTGSTSSNACTKCPAGTYNANTGSTSSNACTKCPAGTYNANKGSTSSNACTACPVGTYNANTGSTSSTACTKCAAGTYNANTGSTSSTACTKCPAGTYNAGTGKSSCTNCPAGTYNSNTGSTSSSACTKCAAGTASSTAGATSSSTCTDCSKGYYSSSEGSTSCTKCAAGTYSSSTGSTSCTSCQSGYTSSAGSDSSSDCYPNYTCSEGELTKSGSSYICVKKAGWETWLGAIWSHNGTSTTDCRKNGGWSWFSATGYAGPGCYNNKEYSGYKCVDGWSDYSGSDSSLKCYKAASKG